MAIVLFLSTLAAACFLVALDFPDDRRVSDEYVAITDNTRDVDEELVTITDNPRNVDDENNLQTVDDQELKSTGKTVGTDNTLDLMERIQRELPSTDNNTRRKNRKRRIRKKWAQKPKVETNKTEIETNKTEIETNKTGLETNKTGFKFGGGGDNCLIINGSRSGCGGKGVFVNDTIIKFGGGGNDCTTRGNETTGGPDCFDKKKGANYKKKGANDKDKEANDKDKEENDKDKEENDKDKEANDKDKEANDKDKEANDKGEDGKDKNKGAIDIFGCTCNGSIAKGEGLNVKLGCICKGSVEQTVLGGKGACSKGKEGSIKEVEKKTKGKKVNVRIGGGGEGAQIIGGGNGTIGGGGENAVVIINGTGNVSIGGGGKGAIVPTKGNGTFKIGGGGEGAIGIVTEGGNVAIGDRCFAKGKKGRVSARRRRKPKWSKRFIEKKNSEPSPKPPSRFSLFR